MAAVAMPKRPHHGQLIRQSGQLGKRAAEGHARKLGGRLAEHAAIFNRRRHLRVEGFHMRRPALQKQHHHRLISEMPFSLRPQRHRIGQRQPADAQGADLEEITAGKALAVAGMAAIEKREHGGFVPHMSCSESGGSQSQYQVAYVHRQRES